MPDIDLDAIEARHKSENWQCCKDVAALVAEVRALRDDVFTLRADARMADDISRDRARERDEIKRLRAVAEAAREHVAAEKDTDLPRIGRAHDAMESALDAWRAGGGA